jgi:hypothetical protein
MSLRSQLLVLILAGACVAETGPIAQAARSKAELKKIILHTRHFGAHGLGYNDSSLFQLSRAITPADIPNLLSLLDEKGDILKNDVDVSVGARFALASQCDATFQPLQQAAEQNQQIAWNDADDIMDLIAGFQGCSPATQAKARAVRSDIHAAAEDRLAKESQRLQEKAADDARIQKNALKMSDPEQKRTLTRAEREEVFRRSIKAAGLENPQTPEQKALVDRMYRTMVLDEPSVKTNQ